ncbi:MAG: serine/threonine-protein kinase [Pseudomonadota bacterium]
MSAGNTLPIGTLIGEYRVEAVIGSGGFGVTYLARDSRLDAPVAVKEYYPVSMAVRGKDYSVRERPGNVKGGYAWGLEKFTNEASMLASLRHPNIVGVNRLFRANGTAYMILDYIDGPNLKVWLSGRESRPDQDDLDALLLPLLEALRTVHAQHLLHRDIAPKNIMISDGFIPVLIDFGAARQLIAQKSQTFAALLTPGYAPFEQYVATGQTQGPWTDIYSLGATVYECITGELPPEAPERTLSDRYKPAARVAAGYYRPDFLLALDWALSPLPKDRPQSVDEWLAGGLTEVVGGMTVPHRQARLSRMSSVFTSLRTRISRWM